MKINEKTIEKIINLEIKIKNSKDKIELSKYNKMLPMYDIYSKNIYFIKKENTHYRLIYSHYRFISIEIIDWLKNQFKKEKNKEEKQKIKNNLIILENYHIETLYKTSIETFFKFSPDLGLNISICKRKSFHPYFSHLKPYYTKLELIKLGLNMNTLKPGKEYDLLDQKIHYKICKKIGKDDFNANDLIKHTNFLIEKNGIDHIKYHTLYGSFINNKYLRENQTSNSFSFNNIYKINQLIHQAPVLEKDCVVYRFIWDDSFLNNLKKGDIFVDKGFLSATRDPFYSPGLQGNFGLTLIKINLPKNKKGTGLLIETSSLFRNENELILAPNTKLKLISKNDQFKYYHINKNFQDLIKKKYEFNFVGISKLSLIKESQDSIPFINLLDVNLSSDTKVERIKEFLKLTNQFNEFQINIGDKTCIFQSIWFDGSGPYSKYYHNKNKDGLSLIHYEKMKPILSIEIGEEMVVNYIHKYYHIPFNFNYIELENTLAGFSKMFGYKEVIYYFSYKNFSEFEDNYSTETKPFLHINYYCSTMYPIIKNNIIPKLNKYWKYNFGFWKIKKIINQKLNEDSKKYWRNDKLKTYQDLYIDIIENNFYHYQKMIERFTLINGKENNPFINKFFKFDSLKYLIDNNIISENISDIKFDSEVDYGDIYDIINRTPLIRR